MSRPAGLAVVVLALAALAAAGCGKTIVDSSKTEAQIEVEVERIAPEAKVSSVSCPADVEVEPGTEFTCTVRLSGGATETATLRIRDENANLTLLGLQPDK